MKSYGAEIHGHILCNDDMEKITAAIMKLKEEGAYLSVCTEMGIRDRSCIMMQ